LVGHDQNQNLVFRAFAKRIQRTQNELTVFKSSHDVPGKLRLNFPRPTEILFAADDKLQAPTSKLQRNSKPQASNAGCGSPPWILGLGASLVLGTWNLELLNAVPLPPI
jgi:hypothetical protein